MGVDLRGTYTAVPQHRLHASYIRAVHQKVRGETMSHSMRAYMLCYSGESSIFIDYSLYAP